MIQARLAAPRRAALPTSLVLGAAVVRALLLPIGDGFSTAVFAASLLAIAVMLFAPQGLWGAVVARFGLELFPLERRVVWNAGDMKPRTGAEPKE